MRFLPRLILFTLTALIANAGLAQDTLKKATAKQAAKPAVTTTKTVNKIPINPKTGRPYSRWGYGTNAKAYQAQKKADSLQKADTVKPAITAAPATAAPVVADKSLNGQYQYLLTKVYNYQQPFIAAFWKNVKDSLNTGRKQLQAANDKLAATNRSLAELQANVAAREDELSKAESVDVLGVSFSKNGYSMMMWGLVLFLGALAAIVIFRSGSARSEAAYRTKLYNELEEEYKNYKAKANEKEKKLARELQTERNKVDELMNRG